MTNKVYHNIESSITFSDSTGDVAITLNNLGYGAGRCSARYDRGTGSVPTRYKVKGVFQFDSAPAEGETVDIYISESDGTNEDGNIGTADAAVSDSDVLKNLKYVGSVVVPNTNADEDFIASFVTNIYERYFSVVVWNSSTADNLQATDDVNKVIVTPIPPEVQ